MSYLGCSGKSEGCVFASNGLYLKVDVDWEYGSRAPLANDAGDSGGGRHFWSSKILQVIEMSFVGLSEGAAGLVCWDDGTNMALDIYPRAQGDEGKQSREQLPSALDIFLQLLSSVRRKLSSSV